jgi:hypothetical protein
VDDEWSQRCIPLKQREASFQAEGSQLTHTHCLLLFLTPPARPDLIVLGVEVHLLVDPTRADARLVVGATMVPRVVLLIALVHLEGVVVAAEDDASFGAKDGARLAPDFRSPCSPRLVAVLGVIQLKKLEGGMGRDESAEVPDGESIVEEIVLVEQRELDSVESRGGILYGSEC